MSCQTTLERTKVCTVCKKDLPESAFGKCHIVKSGLASRCKSCKNKKLREYRHKNKSLVREQAKVYYDRGRKKPEIVLRTIWNNIRKRCYDERCDQYNLYGARGIKIEWSDFEQFKADMLESYREVMNTKNTTIERIDNDKNYSKENCTWADPIVQANNRRSNVFYEYKGELKTLAQLARERGLPYKRVWKRVRTFGWSLHKALEENRL